MLIWLKYMKFTMSTYIVIKMILNIILISQLFIAGQAITNKITPRVCETHIKPGDFMVGGMFGPYRSVNAPCDGHLLYHRINYIESMAYAVDVINKRADILPNVSLGYEIRNNCFNEDITLWTMLTLTSPSRNAEFADKCPNVVRVKSDKVIAVIGPSTSVSSLLAAKVGGMYDVPVISSAATNDELSDTERFPFFFRIVPPDRFQIGAIIDLLVHFHWKYIALFYSVDIYGINGAREIQLMAEKHNICLAINMPVSGDESLQSEKIEIEEKLKSSDKATVIVILSHWKTASTVLRVVKGTGRKFTIIGSDAWGPDYVTSNVQPGSLFVRYRSESAYASPFQDYYKQLPAHLEHSSQWYQDYLNKLIIDNNCTGWKNCKIPQYDDYAEGIIDAVYAVAYALDASLSRNINGSGNNEFNGWTLKENLHRVSFSSRPNHTFKFDKNGDVAGRYDFKSWQKSTDGVFEMISVGRWDPENTVNPLHLNEDLINWETPDGKVPRSICIDECKPGYITVPLKKRCCLGCQRCPEHAIVTNVNETSTEMCLECPVTHWPDATFTNCLTIKPSYIDYDSLVYVLSATGASIGLVLSGVSAVGLVCYSQHALIKSSGRDLSSINIFGLAFSCVVVFIILARPSTVTCIMMDIVITTCVCITFAPVLLKVNRIWRIFTATNGKRPLYTGPKQQIAIAALLIVLQVRICHSKFSCSFLFKMLHTSVHCNAII